MDAKTIQELVCTDQLRRGNTLGLVVASSATHLKICWDDQGNTPTTYSKSTNALSDVVVVRKADRVERGGRVVGFHTRPGALESGEESCESE